jgi:hypothetical protein
MPIDRTVRRRWIGAAVLAAAMVMLLAGQSFLKERLTGVPFMLYWLVCFLLTMSAMLIALRDALTLQQRGRKAHKELLQDALTEIETEARARRGSGKGSPPGAHN